MNDVVIPEARKRGNGGQVTLIVLGILAVAASVLIRFTTHVYGSLGALSLSRANSLCSSSLGIAAQTTSSTASSVCAQVQTYETWCGVLLVGGLIFLAGGAAWLIARKSAANWEAGR